MNILRQKWLYPGLILLLLPVTFGVYVKVLYADFVYDDIGFIVNNKAIQNFSSLSKFFTDPNIFTGSQVNGGAKNWRPVASLVFAVEYKLLGAHPFGFHLISIILHLINVVLVYFLIKKITDNSGIAVMVTSLWGLHPTLTEAVSWVSNQSSLIFLGFFLLAVLTILYYKERKNNFLLWISYLFFAVSLLTKETALGGIFIIPFIFAVSLKQQGTSGFRRVFTNCFPFVLIGLAYFYARYTIIGALGDHALRGSFLENLMLVPAIFYQYIRLICYPVHLLLDYSNFPLPQSMADPRVIAGFLSAIFLAAIVYLGLKKSRYTFVIGVVWFLAFLSPVLQIIPFQDIVGERFLYAPLIGFFLALILGFKELFFYIKKRFNLNLDNISIGVLLLMLSIFFVLTLSRNNDWLNSENLWLSVITIDDNNQRAYENLTAYYLEKGTIDKLIEFSKRLLKINSKNRIGRLHLGIGYALNRQFKEAESMFTDLLKENPNFEPARINLEVLKRNAGMFNDSSFVESTAGAPPVEGNIVNSGIAGRIILGDGTPFEASLDVFKADNMATPFISVRSDAEGRFQIPLRPAFYSIKPSNPAGSHTPLKNQYTVSVGNGQWLQVKVEYK